MFSISFFLFFFNDTATTEIYTLSLHDALPISVLEAGWRQHGNGTGRPGNHPSARSEERRVGKECRSGWAAYDQKKDRLYVRQVIAPATRQVAAIDVTGHAPASPHALEHAMHSH